MKKTVSIADQIGNKAGQKKVLQKTIEIPNPEEIVNKQQSQKEANAAVTQEESDKEVKVDDIPEVVKLNQQNDSTNKPLSVESLKSEFKNFLTLHKGKITALSSNALTNELTLESNQITFMLTNPLEVDAIESIKAELVNHLRNIYGNDSIQLTYEVSSANAVDRPYTPKEKFDAMMKKNPSLAKMKEIMGLDTDF